MGTSETRERIIAGALALFAESGVADATVQDVLDRAHVSRRTFYQYFDGKEDVLAAVYDRWVDGLVQVLAGAVAAPSEPVDKLVSALDAWLRYREESGPAAIHLMVEAARPGSLLHPRRERTHDALVALTSAAVQQVLGARVDPLVFRTLILGVEGLVLHLAALGELSDQRARLRRVIAGLFLTVLSRAQDLPDPPRPPRQVDAVEDKG